MLKMQYPVDYLKKESIHSEVVELSEVEQVATLVRASSHPSRAWQQRSILKRFKRSGDNLELPEGFKVGKAIADGSFFFDLFRQGLEQQKGIKVTVEQLKNDCKEFAQNNPPKWFINDIAKSHDNGGRVRGEAPELYIENISSKTRWGDLN